MDLAADYEVGYAHLVHLIMANILIEHERKSGGLKTVVTWPVWLYGFKVEGSTHHVSISCMPTSSTGVRAIGACAAVVTYTVTNAIHDVNVTLLALRLALE